MKAGRELDALIAEKVMGWKAIPHPCPETLFPGVVPKPSWFPPGFDYEKNKHLYATGLANGVAFPHYSTDIAAAWEVLDHLAGCNTKALFYHDAYVQWQCVLDWQRRTFDDCRIREMADTAPHAICLAALAAVKANG